MTDVHDDLPARRARKQKGLTQTQLAEKVGCSQQNVTDIETGRSQPSLRLALAIADALDSTVDDLFGAKEAS